MYLSVKSQACGTCTREWHDRWPKEGSQRRLMQHTTVLICRSSIYPAKAELLTAITCFHGKAVHSTLHPREEVYDEKAWASGMNVDATNLVKFCLGLCTDYDLSKVAIYPC